MAATIKTFAASLIQMKKFVQKKSALKEEEDMQLMQKICNPYRNQNSGTADHPTLTGSPGQLKMIEKMHDIWMKIHISLVEIPSWNHLNIYFLEKVMATTRDKGQICRI